MNRVLFLISCFIFTFFTSLYAAEIYTYTDKDGNTAISNTPMPEKYKNKAKKIGSYKNDSASEIQRYEMNRKANIARQEAEEAAARQRQQANEVQREAKMSSQKTVEKSRAELERNRLESQRDAFRKFKGGEKDLDDAKMKLENNPDQYFYDKEQRQKVIIQIGQ
jgi:hypothetical protein